MPRAGQIKYFVKHVVYSNREQLVFWFAFVDWFLDTSFKDLYGRPVEIYSRGKLIDKGLSSYIPVQRIRNKIVVVPERLKHQDVYICLPKYDFIGV